MAAPMSFAHSKDHLLQDARSGRVDPSVFDAKEAAYVKTLVEADIKNIEQRLQTEIGPGSYFSSVRSTIVNNATRPLKEYCAALQQRIHKLDEVENMRKLIQVQNTTIEALRQQQVELSKTHRRTASF